MPIDTMELMEAVGALMDNENVRVTVKSSAKGAAICAASCFIGGLLGGSKGLALGGTIGAVSAAIMSRGQFRPVSEIILHEMSERDREQLKDRVVYAVRDFHPTDMGVLLSLLMGNKEVQKAVLNTVTTFITNEMDMQIVD
ncbi:protein C19orf12 homolog [Wyeomyia smithii]|uniref:protein C19orf12 homolog n=1 Tax=Wyeomyia smithii TaxID=174621 RepID=UPI002467FF77|nr:protein C19orf12 homolog [Wyeomyia smithii]XP_055541201.1 protein C19orf12 homolog [Wyeomyia smithii]XP_055541202.1 protein C19orf12 homolog [Wyeomyia smithii]XP_055541203.1 protein C19orf12 homolog [Wyeomyia smithii]XP_055548004.1 protein C19orf12 homolog [Wyeomyia smithii]XP_055548005.1 protein C19orf12 homolog [Wyeomyia smithii]XP_055548006.1 protein C19orf12 homolog [Wyeomyia smithii]XP_055548007.1 protein C19orf12 homolog [Wyeomyia smithii]